MPQVPESPLLSNDRLGRKGTGRNIFRIEGQIHSLEASNLRMHAFVTHAALFTSVAHGKIKEKVPHGL